MRQLPVGTSMGHVQTFPLSANQGECLQVVFQQDAA